jgi:Rhs element Vgr protein
MTENSKVQLPDMKIRMSFTILVNGKEIDTSFQVVSINISREFNKISSAEIVMLDGDVAKGDFEISGGSEFVIGNELTVEAGYDEKNEIIFKGIIVKHAIKTDSEDSQLIITAKHAACKMAMKRCSTVYSDMTDSEIFSQIASKYGLKVETEDTAHAHESLTQFNSSDWDFMNMRAEANAMLLYTANDKIVIHQPKPGGETKLEIHYGTTIFDFEAEIDGRTSFADYKATSWNYIEQELDEVEEKSGIGETAQGNLPISELASSLGNDSREMQVPAPMNDQGALNNWLNSMILLDNLSRITGSVCVYGIGDMMPGDIIDVQRLGDRFNGKTLVSSVEQKIEDGSWQTTLKFGLDATVYARKYDDVNELKASGMLAAVNGLQIAKVVQIEDDPLGEDRVMVRFPLFVPGEDTFWARVATLDAGNERGVCFFPEVDDEVVVGFVNDHPNSAVILGMLHSSSLPSPVKADKKNPLKGIYTREKIKLEFDDEKKSINIETPGGNKVIISDDAQGVLLEDQNGNRIVMNGDGITVESAKALNLKAANDVTIEGANVNIKAQAAFKAEGASGAEVSSSGNAVIKGAMVQIN